MLHKILLALLIVQFHMTQPGIAGAQAAGAQLPPRGAQDRASQAVAAALDRMVAGDPEGAIQVLRPIGATSPSTLEVERAQCLMAAALSMNGELHASEEGAEVLNHPATPARQAAWKQALPECIRQLEGIAARVEPDRRAALYYFLGIIGFNETEHIRHLREAVKLRPDFSEAGYQLGVHLLGSGKLDEAAAIFRRVAEQRPEWAEPRSNIGVALTLSGRPAEAIREFQEALKVRPEFAEAHGQLGLAYYTTGDYENAMNECGMALRAEPDNPLYHNCAAVILLEKNRVADAVAYARRATKLAPSHETFQVVLAAALFASGQQEEARAVIRRAVSAEPRLRTDPSRLEKAHLLRGRALALARQVLEKAASQ